MRQKTLKMLGLHYKVAGHRKMIEARAFIERTMVHPSAISVSWGKDSVLTAWLALPFLEKCDWLFHVSAGEYEFPGMAEVREKFLSQYSRHSYREYQAADYFESATAYGLVDISVSDTTKIRSKKIDGFHLGEEGCSSRIWGLRAEESPDRRRYARYRRRCHKTVAGIVVLSPILYWSWIDVWSVIIANDLPYCQIYDKYDEIDGLDFGRSGTWAGTRGAHAGRLALLKRFYPDLFNRFAAEFPEVRCYV